VPALTADGAWESVALRRWSWFASRSWVCVRGPRDCVVWRKEAAIEDADADALL
jgi:hypothetical protein